MYEFRIKSLGWWCGLDADPTVTGAPSLTSTAPGYGIIINCARSVQLKIDWFE